jgi:hypothetical protein
MQRPLHGPAVGKGGCLRGIRLFVFLALLASAAAPAQTAMPERLAELKTLAEAGAPGLALQLIEREQGEPTDNAAWMRWEQTRIALLAASGQWEAIEQRLSQIAPLLPSDRQPWALEQRAVARVESGQNAAARDLLQRLFWTVESAEADDFARWQRLLIRSYLAEGRAADAFVVMARYRQDHPERSDEERLLTARVFLQNDRPGDAAVVLTDLALPEAQGLRLFARLRRGDEARLVLQEARKRLKDERLPAAVRPLFQAVEVEAAAAMQDYAAEVLALEQVLPHAQALHGVSAPGAADLWQAYFGYALVVANREQLLVGQDGRWFAEAESAGRMYPVKARSLYAWLAHNAADESARERAHHALVERITGLQDGAALLQVLYLDVAGGDPATLPMAVRWALFDSALRRADLRLASQLVDEMEQPPPGVSDGYGWRLRRARILLLGGRHGAAVEAIDTLTPPPADAASERTDQLMQLLFDLQSVGEHAAAYAAFEKLFATAQGQPRRELLYWMADSRSAQERHAEAAALYLRSAVLDQPGAMDPWAQTARYQAAQALAKAGLYEDAEHMLRTLLKATEDPARRALLGREIEQLRLARNNHE